MGPGCRSDRTVPDHLHADATVMTLVIMTEVDTGALRVRSRHHGVMLAVIGRDFRVDYDTVGKAIRWFRQR